MNESTATAMREDVFRQMERSERFKRMAFYGGALLEAAFLAAFLLLADFSNRTHVLLLLSTVAGYTIVILGLVAVAAQVEKNSLRMLKALEAVAGSS